MINGNPILARSAVNKGYAPNKDGCVYEVDDGNIVLHDPDDGAVQLAKKLLDLIKESK